MPPTRSPQFRWARHIRPAEITIELRGKCRVEGANVAPLTTAASTAEITIVLLALVISAVLAAVVSGATLAPLRDISAQLDRISAGQYDAPIGNPGGVQRRRGRTGPGKPENYPGRAATARRTRNLQHPARKHEFGYGRFGRRLAVVHARRPSGDGESRRRKVSGASSGEFLGRRVTEIFPQGHPLRAVLHIEGEELREVAAETELVTAGGFRRVGVSVQAIQEGGERIGALITLRDLDSLESINTQLQVSERLAALGRITAGVAHEVKNPLNSMRLWLENLKESLPDGPGQRSAASCTMCWTRKLTGSTRW